MSSVAKVKPVYSYVPSIKTSQSTSMNATRSPQNAPHGFYFNEDVPRPARPGSERSARSGYTTHRSDSTRRLKGPTAAEMMMEDQDTKPGRSPRHNIHAIVFDVLIALCSSCFIVFAALAYAWDDRPASDFETMALLRAAKFGPTILPILFALILARLIKAVATWRLEQGATVGTLEHLLGSRSFAAAFMAPVKFRTMNIMVPVVVILWAFSPIGGQSALRIVTVEPLYTNTTVSFQYVNLSESRFTIGGGSSGATYSTGVNAAFNAALMSSSVSKNGTQDVYGNIQIPMLEAIPSTIKPDRDGWFNTTDKQNMTYVSLLGIPTIGVVDDANSTFNIETSYFNVSCAVEGTKHPSGQNVSLESDGPRETTFTNQGWSVWYDDSHFWNSTESPRSMGFKSYVNAAPKDSDRTDMQLTDAVCTLSTTYAEASIFCNATRSCNVIAIRESRIYHPSKNISALDGITIPNNDTNNFDNNTDLRFFQNFVDSLGTGPVASSSPIEAFFIDPAFPYAAGPALDWYAIWPIGSDLFSRRFSQLLNTYWLSGIAPSGITGDFTSPSNDQYRVATVEGTRTTVQAVMRCHMPYLTLLVIASGIMLVAGILTAILDGVRRGPDVLEDGFVSGLRHNPYVNVDMGASMEDGAEMARRLRETRVRLGDVKPDDPVGFVAIATPSDKQPVVMVQPDRQYS